MTACGTTNENSTVRFKEWMIVILSIIKTYTISRDGWLQIEGLNKYIALKVFQKSSQS